MNKFLKEKNIDKRKTTKNKSNRNKLIITGIFLLFAIFIATIVLFIISFSEIASLLKQKENWDIFLSFTLWIISTPILFTSTFIFINYFKFYLKNIHENNDNHKKLVLKNNKKIDNQIEVKKLKIKKIAPNLTTKKVQKKHKERENF
jgi:formate hydrogenlyase subunit 3/multisubunit Na+/H+ antiporter MnhD subunit